MTFRRWFIACTFWIVLVLAVSSIGLAMISGSGPLSVVRLVLVIAAFGLTVISGVRVFRATHWHIRAVRMATKRPEEFAWLTQKYQAANLNPGEMLRQEEKRQSLRSWSSKHGLWSNKHDMKKHLYWRAELEDLKFLNPDQSVEEAKQLATERTNRAFHEELDRIKLETPGMPFDDARELAAERALQARRARYQPPPSGPEV
ncbi:MAG TPA: hypothetical protein VHR45_22915 [Thermoanaerobaculia bacterium]|nr:hypothetical protein [Thermoanaerobaculia bacterium]